MLVQLHEQDAVLKAEEPGLRAAHPWGMLMLQVINLGERGSRVPAWRHTVRACVCNIGDTWAPPYVTGSTPVTQGVFTERHCS